MREQQLELVVRPAPRWQGGFEAGGPGGGDAASDSSVGGDAGDAASPGDSGEGGAHHDGFGGAVPASTTATYRIAAGSGVVMSPGATSFYITASAGTYRLTWQGSGEVWGSVWTAGHITSVSPGCVDTSSAHGSRCLQGFVDAVRNSGGEAQLSQTTVPAPAQDSKRGARRRARCRRQAPPRARATA